MIRNITKSLFKYIAHIVAVAVIIGTFPICADAESISTKGVNTHFTHFTDSEQDLTSLYETGAETIRDSIYWSHVENIEGVYDWSRYDWWLNELNDKNKDIYIVVTSLSPPSFYYTDDSKAFFSTEAERTAFCNFLKALIKRYPFIDYIELWNEPNYGFGTNATQAERMNSYVAMVKEASEAIREVSSDIEIVGGCVAFEDEDAATDARINAVDYINTVLPEIYPYIDALSWHTYAVKRNAEGSTMQERVKAIKDEVTACGGWKKIYISETGWVTGDVDSVSVSKDTQAYNIAKVFPVMEENNIDGTLIYDFRNDGEDETEAEHNFGLINYDRTIKPSYTYFSNHISKTKNYTHVGEYTESDTILTKKEVHLYVGENDAIKMSWQTPTFEYTSYEPSYTENITLSEAKSLFKDIVSAKYDELSSKATSLNIDISTSVAQIQSYITNGYENDAYIASYDLGMELLKMQLSDQIAVEAEELSDLLYDIHQIGKRMSAVYDIESDIAEDDILSLDGKYEAVEEALENFDNEKVVLSEAMLNIGRGILNEIKANICKEQSDDNYKLYGTGKLKVYGDAPAGSYVSIKIEKDSNTIYANTIGADSDNKYEFEVELSDDGAYDVSVFDFNNELKTFTVERMSNILSEEFVEAEYVVDYARKMLLVTGCDDLTGYIEKNEKNGKIYAEFDIQNGFEEQDLFLFLAGYSDEVLQKCVALPIELEKGENKTEILSIDALNDGNYKIFVWNNTLKPYSSILQAK